MNRRVLARIKVMVVTVMFIGGFSAFNPACSQSGHASDVDQNGAPESATPEFPVED